LTIDEIEAVFVFAEAVNDQVVGASDAANCSVQRSWPKLCISSQRECNSADHEVEAAELGKVGAGDFQQSGSSIESGFGSGLVLGECGAAEKNESGASINDALVGSQDRSSSKVNGLLNAPEERCLFDSRDGRESDGPSEFGRISAAKCKFTIGYNVGRGRVE